MENETAPLASFQSQMLGFLPQPLFVLCDLSMKCAIRQGKRSATPSSGCIIYYIDRLTDRQTDRSKLNDAERKSEKSGFPHFPNMVKTWFFFFFLVTAELELRDQWLFAYQVTSIKSLPGITWLFGRCLTEQINPGKGKNILVKYL